MHNVIPFKFNQTDIRVISDADGEPWFIAKEVADVLGYSDAFEMTKRLDEDEKQNLQIAGFGPRGVTIINESGLYSAILGSSKPEAKPFKRWVTRDVLPSIRKTGGYTAEKPDVPTAITAARVFPLHFRIARLIGCDKNAAAIAANNATQKLTGSNVLALMDMTAIPAENQESLAFTASELGIRLGVSGQKFNKMLEKAGLQVKDSDHWRPTDAAAGYFRIFDTGKKHGNGTPIQQVKWLDTVLPMVEAAA